MGFTRYWHRTDRPIPAALVADVEAVRHLHGGLAGWDGTGQPEITAERIVFNEPAPDDGETFSLTAGRGELGFGFCKTGQDGYDSAVAAVLLLAERYGVVSDLAADGEGTWEEGRRLMRRATMHLIPGAA